MIYRKSLPVQGFTMEPRDLKELESKFLEFLKCLDSTVASATHVNQILSPLRSLASLLFLSYTDYAADDIDNTGLKQIIEFQQSRDLSHEAIVKAFYSGLCFTSLANLLLYKVASNWLACFPFSARVAAYDKFFTNAPVIEAFQALIPCLNCQSNNVTGAESDEVDSYSVCLNSERLLILIFIENNGIARVAEGFGTLTDNKTDEAVPKWTWNRESISRIAQMTAAIPDKTRLNSSKELSAHLFFQHITKQLLAAADKRFKDISKKLSATKDFANDVTFIFIGETFSRICRRGHADVIIAGIIEELLQQIRTWLCSEVSSLNEDTNTISNYWQILTLVIKDFHALERWTESLLRKMSVTIANDLEGYWILWSLFDKKFRSDASSRILFTEKFLLWKIFPLNCLRWILQFAIFCFPPSSDQSTPELHERVQINVVKHLANVWCKREFIQETTVEKQAYITTAIALSLQKMTKTQMEAGGELMRFLLEGISCRLDSPVTSVRKMASCVALIFSRIIDPNKPLFLDETCNEEIDWDFGVTGKQNFMNLIEASNDVQNNAMEISLVKQNSNKVDTTSEDVDNCLKIGKIDASRQRRHEDDPLDPDEVIDPALLNKENYSNEDDNESLSSKDESESSLVPYDMTDDESDLKREKLPAQLNDCLKALRKSDDPDSVERALEVVEKLVRSLPDELDIFASELAQALVHVRCNDIAVEGEEDSEEEKRHRALVALLVSCPLKSVDTVTSILYSAHVDVSQRILILDVMTDAAKELSVSSYITSTNNHKQKSSPAITEIGNQPWYCPSSWITPPGAGPWREASDSKTLISWSTRYERELPSKSGDRKAGKTRIWGNRSLQLREKQAGHSVNSPVNKFPLYAAAFMLPVMHRYDKKSHGVDLLGRDFIVLGKLIYMLGVCMESIALHPEAMTLAIPLLDMLSSRDISHHPESYVRKSALYAASRTMTALHPTYVAAAFSEGDHEVIKLLEWIRTWAIHIADNDIDHDCTLMAMACIQLHSELAFQAARLMKPSRDFNGELATVSHNMPGISIRFPEENPHSNVPF